jgi:hypothetical protein
MAHRAVSGEPFSQVETQREGIMFEGLHSALGGIGCVSFVEYFASTNGTMSAMCWPLLEQPRRSSASAKLGNMATFPKDDLRTPAIFVF